MSQLGGNFSAAFKNVRSESQTAGIYINVVVGSITITLCLLVFECIRHRFPSIYDTRRLLNARRHPVDYYNNRIYTPPPPSSSYFGWIRSAIVLDLDSVAKTHGLDTALFLRFLRTMSLFFLILLIPSAILVPVYYTGRNKSLPEDHSAHTVGIQRLSLSNVSSDDHWRFWVTLAIDNLVVILTLALINHEFNTYVGYRVRYRASKNPSNYTILVQDIPPHAAGSTAVRHYWNRVFPSQIARSYYVFNSESIVSEKKKFWDEVSKKERAEWEYAHTGKRPTFKPGPLSCFKRRSTPVDSIEYHAQRQMYHANKINEYQNDVEHKRVKPTRTAFVVFKSRRIAASAAQTSFAEHAGEWTVSWAPEPNAVNWSALGIPGYQSLFRNAITIFGSVAFTLLWVIPVSAIMGLTNLTVLSNVEINGNKPFHFLEGLRDWSPTLIGVLESYLPALVLSTFLSYVPSFLRFFVSFSRVPSLAVMDRRVRDWYFNFVVFSNFLFVLASGSLLNRLPEIIDQPKLLASFLASSAPRQGAFMANFVLLKGLSETPREILQISRLFVRKFLLIFVARTKRQQNRANVGNTNFLYYYYYAMSQLIVLIGLVYSTISPYIIPACLAYFLVMYIVWKYNLCYSFYNKYSSGGDFYGGALYGVWTGLFLHLLTMIGLFGINSNPVQSALIVIPAALAVGFLIHLRRTFTRIAQNGSSLAILKREEVSCDEDTIPDEVAKKYVHPGMVPLPDPVEDLNGVNSDIEAFSSHYVDEIDEEGKHIVDQHSMSKWEGYDATNDNEQTDLSDECERLTSRTGSM